MPEYGPEQPRRTEANRLAATQFRAQVTGVRTAIVRSLVAHALLPTVRIGLSSVHAVQFDAYAAPGHVSRPMTS